MMYEIKIERNILYARNISDPDPDFELIPISKINFVGKVIKQRIGDDDYNQKSIWLFQISIPQGNITIPSLQFTEELEISEIVLESIRRVREARKTIADAVELYHGGIIIGKPNIFKHEPDS